MNRFEIIVVTGILILLSLSTCGHPPDLIPDGIYGHPSNEDEFKIPDNATPIEPVNNE